MQNQAQNFCWVPMMWDMIFSANWFTEHNILLLVGLTSAAIAAGIGIVVGVLSGWFGGMIDSILMKITSFFITIPWTYP